MAQLIRRHRRPIDCRAKVAPRQRADKGPFQSDRINAIMISALKMTAERIALSGVARRIMLKIPSAGYVVANAAGMIAKYLATSLAMLKVVNEPRVINNCFPTSTVRSIWSDYCLSRFMLAAPGRLGPGSSPPPHPPGPRQAHHWSRPGHGHHLTLCLIITDEF